MVILVMYICFQEPVLESTYNPPRKKSTGALGDSSESDRETTYWPYQTSLRDNKNTKITMKTDRYGAVSIVTTEPKEVRTL